MELTMANVSASSSGSPGNEGTNQREPFYLSDCNCVTYKKFGRFYNADRSAALTTPSLHFTYLSLHLNC